MKNLKVALVHDFLVEYGGGERVLETFHEIFPDAPIFTAYFNLNGFGPHKERVGKWNIRSSWMQKIPFARKLVSPFRIFAPMIFEGFDLSEYDLVISSCNSYFAKAVITKPESLHISYIHTPPRYLYGYTTSFNYKKHWWVRAFAEIANHFLRIYDFETSQRPDILVANSRNVKERIKKFYKRDSVVVYPPIDIELFNKFKKQQGDYFLSLGRLVRGKGTETIIKACTDLNLPLKVVGNGPEFAKLKQLAGKDIQFLGQVSDQERVEILALAKALIVASEDEDFGITAVESQAAGTPVIAIKEGGYLETVIAGKTGEFFERGDMSFGYINMQTVENLKTLLKGFDSDKYKAEDCRKNAQKFSNERFKKEVWDLVEKNQKAY